MELNDARYLLTSDWSADLTVAVPKGSKVIVVCSRGSIERGTLNSIRNALAWSEVVLEVLAPETPDLTFLQEIFEPVSSVGVNCIVAVGGGSVLDTAKAIKMMFCVRDWMDFQHQAAQGVSCEGNSCLLVAIPTTAGSGSEVTPFATLWDREAHGKLSIDAPWLLPSVAIVDPHLLSTLSGDRLLYPALDAISHAIESIWSKKKTTESREYALKALAFSEVSIQSFVNGSPELTQFALASTYAGRAIAISRTALAHSISYPLTIAFGVPHGLACSFTLRAIFLRVVKLGLLDEEEERHVESILGIIQQLRIGPRLLEYCSVEEALMLSSQMNNSLRSNNFCLQLSAHELQSVLAESIFA